MARSSLPRRLGAASLLTTLVLTSASCGGDTDSKATDDSSSSESSNTDDSTDDAGTDADASSGDLEELSADEFYPAVMAAMQDAETMNFSITTTGGPTATEMTGSMRYADDGIEMKASSTGAAAMEMAMIDKTLYISGAGLPLPEGKKWLKVDLSDPDSLFGQLGKSTDPSAMFKAMEVPKSFELVGTEDIDGVATNHYNVVMDTASYSKAMDLPAEVADFMPKEIGIDMWIDADNRPRQFSQELEVPSATGTPTKTTTVGKYFDFGTDVELEAPPAAEVADNVPGIS